MISKSQIKYIRQLQQKKFRQQEGLFVAEGPKVVGDLLRHYAPVALYATSQYHHPAAVEISEAELCRVSSLQHPQQVLALFRIPDREVPPPDVLARSLTKLSLALDGVQDPGNLGTIIRIADWFGIDTVYCSHDTADAYNPKVVQATMGSIARVRMVYTDLAGLLSHLPSSCPVYGTLLDGDDIYRQPLSDRGVIVMGNEGNGISEAVRRHVSHRLLIPSFHTGDSAESLNVAIATAITCSEFRRRGLAGSERP